MLGDVFRSESEFIASSFWLEARFDDSELCRVFLGVGAFFLPFRTVNRGIFGGIMVNTNSWQFSIATLDPNAIFDDFYTKF